MSKTFLAAALVAVTAAALSGPAGAQQATAPKHPQREVYFGETHLHTSWSLDAFVISPTVRNGPEVAWSPTGCSRRTS